MNISSAINILADWGYSSVDSTAHYAGFSAVDDATAVTSILAGQVLLGRFLNQGAMVADYVANGISSTLNVYRADYSTVVGLNTVTNSNVSLQNLRPEFRGDGAGINLTAGNLWISDTVCYWAATGNQSYATLIPPPPKLGGAGTYQVDLLRLYLDETSSTYFTAGWSSNVITTGNTWNFDSMNFSRDALMSFLSGQELSTSIRYGMIGITQFSAVGTAITATSAAGSTYTVGDSIILSGFVGTEQIKLNGLSTTITAVGTGTFSFVAGSSLATNTYTTGMGGCLRLMSGGTIGITNYTVSSTGITVTANTPSNEVSVGDVITISGAVGTEQAKLNGVWSVTATGTNTFTFLVNTQVTSGTYNSALGTCVKSVPLVSGPGYTVLVEVRSCNSNPGSGDYFIPGVWPQNTYAPETFTPRIGEVERLAKFKLPAYAGITTQGA